MDTMPFGSVPLKIALSSAEKAVKGLKSSAGKMESAVFHETLARAYYSLGMLDKAISTQKKAIAMLKEIPEKQKRFNTILDFYKEAEKLKASLKNN
jgi:tetratricopeptide (TPR) repeat protein